MEVFRSSYEDRSIKIVDIMVDLPKEVNDRLTQYLKENKYMLALDNNGNFGHQLWSHFHSLSIWMNPLMYINAIIIQLLEKEEAIKRAVEDLLKGDFVKKFKYSIWLSSVILVKNQTINWGCDLITHICLVGLSNHLHSYSKKNFFSHHLWIWGNHPIRDRRNELEDHETIIKGRECEKTSGGSRIPWGMSWLSHNKFSHTNTKNVIKV